MRYLIVRHGTLPYSETFVTSLASFMGVEAGLLYGRPPEFVLKNGKAEGAALPFWRQRITWGISRRLFSNPETISHKQILRALSPAVVLAQFGPTGVSMMRACEQTKIPLITFFRGYDATKTSVLEHHSEGYRRLMSGDSRVFVTVSRSLRKILIALGASPKRTFVSPSGAVVDHFNTNKEVPNPLRFLAVGRFVEKKAPHLTIMAFSKVLTDFPDATLRMVGDGELLGPCKAIVRALGIENNVSFTGALPHEKVRAEMAQATAFLQHSVTATSGDQEGTPVSVTEASASGLPVVSTRHAGIPDLVIHGHTGLLVDEYDVDGMAKAMCRLLESPSFAENLGQRAAERVHTYFDSAKLATRVQAIADWTIDPSRPKPALVPEWLKHSESDATGH